MKRSYRINGGGLIQQASAALKEWGTPTTPSDLSHLFTSYLSGSPSHPTTPFCDLPLSPESQTILPTLLKLNSAEKQYWTVGSQPAVDAADSGDKVHGWGPEGGYVFQKAFVEFFVPKEEVERVRAKVEGRGVEFSMYASNKEVRSSRPLFFSTLTPGMRCTRSSQEGRFQHQRDPRVRQCSDMGRFPRQRNHSIYHHRARIVRRVERRGI